MHAAIKKLSFDCKTQFYSIKVNFMVCDLYKQNVIILVDFDHQSDF